MIIYLDNNATTQPLPEVVEAMRACLTEDYANPSSIHQFGQAVRHQVECAREKVAGLLGASPKEIIFTGGGTESINLAIRGGVRIHPHRRHFVTTAVEHSAVKRIAEQLTVEGYVVDSIGVDREGRLDEDEFRQKVTDQTALVSLIHANNETGVVFDVGRLAAIAAEKGVPVHVDAVQSAGKMPLDVTAWPVQLISLAAHKFHGPKGVGALYVRRRTRLEPMILGGSQERQLRGGTENVEGIVGMGVAVDIALRDRESIADRAGKLRDSFEEKVLGAIPIAHVNARGAERIYNTSNIGFEGLQSEAILILLSEAGICASAGAACSSGSLEPSHVLKAMKLDERTAHGSIRFSFSRFNTMLEVEEVVRLLPGIIARLQAISTK